MDFGSFRVSTPKTAIQKAKAAGAIAAKKMVVASAAAQFQPWAKFSKKKSVDF